MVEMGWLTGDLSRAVLADSSPEETQNPELAFDFMIYHDI